MIRPRVLMVTGAYLPELSGGGLQCKAIIDALGAFTGGLDTANAATSTSTQRLLMVGDSLTVGSLPYQAGAFIDTGWTDIAINAHGSRGIKTKVSADPYTGLTAVDALRAAHGDADLWVVALGTNDAGQVYAKMRELKTRFPDDVAYDVMYDTTVFVQATIESVIHTLIEAFVLVAIVVFIFLGNLRATLIPIIAVPVALVGTFAVMLALGFSANTIQMLLAGFSE